MASDTEVRRYRLPWVAHERIIRGLMYRTLIVSSIALTAVGCSWNWTWSKPISPVAETSAPITATTDDEYFRVFDAALDMLRRARFRPDRVDRRRGVITTQPETSQHFFEFWRHDVDTPMDFAESTLKTIRRRVKIEIRPTDSQMRYDIVVTVKKEQFSAPDRQITNSAASLRIFSSGLPTTTGERFNPETDITWIDIGRDARMENRLLDRILVAAQCARLDREE